MQCSSIVPRPIPSFHSSVQHIEKLGMEIRDEANSAALRCNRIFVNIGSKFKFA